MARWLSRIGVIVWVGSLGACAKIAGLESSAEPTHPATGDADGGPIESPVHLAGDVEITPDTLEFGEVVCGDEATEQFISVINKTAEPLMYEADIQPGSGFVVRGKKTGEVPPNGTAKIAVVAAPASANDLRGGILINAGRSYIEVLAHAKGMGGVLEFVPPLADFGEIRMGTTATPIPVELRNTGTATATITAAEGKGAGLDLTWTPAGPLTIAPGESRTVDAAFVAPPQVQLGLEATFQPVVSSALCAARPALRARGSSVNTDVTLSVADFGVQACNSTPPNRTVTVSNYSNRAIQLSNIRLPTPSRFSVAQTTLDVPRAQGGNPGTATINVSANPLGASIGLVEEDLTVDVVNAGARTTKVRLDAHGAILQITPPVQNFTFGGLFTTWKTFAIRNTGNAEITVSYDYVRTVGPAAWFPERDSHRIGPNQTLSIDMGFRPDPFSFGNFENTLTPRRTAGATACTTMPVATSRGTN